MLAKQTVRWPNIDPDLKRFMVSLDHNELTWLRRVIFVIYTRPSAPIPFTNTVT